MVDEASEASSELVDRLNKIADLLALTLVRRLDDQEKIRVLDAVGYTPAEIATFLNKKPNAISAALYRQRKLNSKKSTRRRRQSIK